MNIFQKHECQPTVSHPTCQGSRVETCQEEATLKEESQELMVQLWVTVHQGTHSNRPRYSSRPWYSSKPRRRKGRKRR